MLISSKQAGVAQLVEHLICNPYEMLSRASECAEGRANPEFSSLTDTPCISLQGCFGGRHGGRRHSPSEAHRPIRRRGPSIARVLTSGVVRSIADPVIRQSISDGAMERCGSE